eukprot:TRINITY_DN10146_c0_g1_i1.p2 TRINITY_DN10146_c0_g1~~TRINITY_DN10146_c0_g1_i1.p2  ORF type:complete len:165 (+),score=11.32 TRINITY_DN10146_c0_g1_i1:380-874(+)
MARCKHRVPLSGPCVRYGHGRPSRTHRLQRDRQRLHDIDDHTALFSVDDKSVRLILRGFLMYPNWRWVPDGAHALLMCRRFCSDVYEGKREQSCHSGKYIGLAFGEVLLCILLYVLYKVPRTSSNIGEGEVETTRRDLVLPGYDQESAEENANPWNQPPAKLES